jgi:hypothetical protein
MESMSTHFVHLAATLHSTRFGNSLMVSNDKAQAHGFDAWRAARCWTVVVGLCQFDV